LMSFTSPRSPSTLQVKILSFEPRARIRCWFLWKFYKLTPGI
jgi:hypothetical protein